jgi:hypothetical protein
MRPAAASSHTGSGALLRRLCVPPTSPTAVDLPRLEPRCPTARAELASRPWWWSRRSTPAGHGGGSGGARRGGSRGARLTQVPSPPAAPAGLQLPASRRRRPPAPPGPRRRPPTRNRPGHLACASCPGGPHRGQGWQRGAQRGAKRRSHDFWLRLPKGVFGSLLCSA